MTGTFKANNPYNNFLLFAYGLVLKLPMFLFPQVPKPQQLDGILYRTILKWLAPAGSSFPVIYSLIAFFFLYVQAISFNKLLNDQRLLPRPNYLAGMSYLLVTSLFTEWYVLSAPLIINTLLIWVLSRLCNLYNNPNAKTTLFNIGLVTGMATLLYFPSIAFSLLIIVGIVITRPFKLPEWLIAFVGMLTPYYFLGAWFFLTNSWQKYHFPGVSVTLPKFNETGWAYTAIIFVLIIIVIGMVFIQNNIRRLLVQSRKSWSLIYLYLLIALLVPFLNAAHSFDYWILTAVPAAGFAAAAFLFPERKWFALFFHWSLVALSVVMGYFIR
ncbi:MAG: hypothetical protein H7258_14380 [Ferruginibacter sp.]|nr:hypothetical protein [Ferruginibacter sp.]